MYPFTFHPLHTHPAPCHLRAEMPACTWLGCRTMPLSLQRKEKLKAAREAMLPSWPAGGTGGTAGEAPQGDSENEFPSVWLL